MVRTQIQKTKVMVTMARTTTVNRNPTTPHHTPSNFNHDECPNNRTGGDQEMGYKGGIRHREPKYEEDQGYKAKGEEHKDGNEYDHNDVIVLVWVGVFVGLVSCTLVIQSISCEGCHRHSSCSKSIVGTQVSRNWGMRVGCVRCGYGGRCWDVHSTTPFVMALFVLPE
jgi:hypothetical protein